jgi:hypothetical protein
MRPDVFWNDKTITMPHTEPRLCELAHPGFRMLGEPVFRLSEGTRVPSMVVLLEKQEAVLPLRSVAREFGIDPESPDGQMLQLIERALDFVVAVRLGHPLPPELNGQASWTPAEQDKVMPGWETTGNNHDLVKTAITGAAAHLENLTAADVTARVAELCEEMACVETMRRALMRGIAPLRAKLLGVQEASVPVSRRDTVIQVQALARRGLKPIADRFDEVDGRLDNILSMLGDMPPAVAWLRDQRDWMFRTHQAWEGVFTDWTNAPNHFDEFMWKAVERTYQFLAPRYMSFQEWSAMVDAQPARRVARVQVW